MERYLVEYLSKDGWKLVAKFDNWRDGSDCWHNLCRLFPNETWRYGEAE